MAERSTGWKAGRRSRAATSWCAAGDGRRPTSRPKPFNVRTRVHEYGGGAWTVVGRRRLFLEFRRGRLYRQATARRAAAADACAARARARVAVCRWHHRPASQALDRRARGPHRRRRAGQHHRRGRSCAAAAATRAHPRRADTISSARRGCRPMAGGSSWLAWDHPNMPWNGTTLYLADARRGRRAWRRRSDRRRPGRIDLPARMVARRQRHRVRVRSFAAGGISTASTSRRGRRGRSRRWTAEFGLPQWNLRHVDLCLRRRPTGSSAPIPRPGSAASRCST